MTDVRVLERAFQIARSGAVGGVPHLRKLLQREGFTYIEISADLSGSAVQRQLRDAIIAAKGQRPAMEPER
jgi:hypothetical protein